MQQSSPLEFKIGLPKISFTDFTYPEQIAAAVSLRNQPPALLPIINRRFGPWNRCAWYVVSIWGVGAIGGSVAAQANEKLTSPSGKYSVEVVRNSEPGLVLSQSRMPLAKIPTEVGPVDSRFEALWSPGERYLAINKQRSSRTGGDEMWIVALPSGKVLRQPDDGLWNELEEKASADIDEKHETSGKVFLTLIATGWVKGGLRFRLEEWFSEMEDWYFFDGTVEPLNLRMINDWKVSQKKAKAAASQMRPEGVVSKPVSAEVLDTPAQSQLKAENIKITGADGHTETITHGGNCREPSISSKGDVGWTRCSGFDRKGYALNEKLVVRLPDGRTREFAPNSKAPFITGWKFVDNDSGVLIRSMSFHSPQSYIRYDLATGKMTNRKDGTNDAEPMPSGPSRLETRRVLL